MSNPFENVPSSADLPQNIDKKTVSALSDLVDRLEKSVGRKEALVKNKDELAGVVFDILLDDDGSFKDFLHSVEIQNMIDNVRNQQKRTNAKFGEIIRSVPTSIKANLSNEDRKRLGSNSKRCRDLCRLCLPTIGIAALAVGIILTGTLMLTNSASDTKREYAQRINQPDLWYEDKAISFGQFYRENFPKTIANGAPAIGSNTSPSAAPSAAPIPSAA